MNETLCAFDVQAAFGRSRVKADAAFDGIPYAGSLVRMSTPGRIPGLRKDIRAKTGRQAGNMVHVTVRQRSRVSGADAPLFYGGSGAIPAPYFRLYGVPSSGRLVRSLPS
ncbi:DUF1905 domain-containing protein [Dysosmobacter sp.]